MQTSESFRLSAILSFSGGLQDAYTYNTRGSVFANAQTGNVVLDRQCRAHEPEPDDGELEKRNALFASSDCICSGNLYCGADRKPI